MFKLRAVLLQGALADSVFGLLLLVFASCFQSLLDIGIREEPLFIRIAGGFLIFVGYLYYLTYRDHEKYPILIQATFVLRIIFTLLLLSEIFILLPRPFALVHIALLILALGEVYFGVMQAYHLKKLGMPLIP